MIGSVAKSSILNLHDSRIFLDDFDDSFCVSVGGTTMAVHLLKIEIYKKLNLVLNNQPITSFETQTTEVAVTILPKILYCLITNISKALIITTNIMNLIYYISYIWRENE